MNLRLPLLFATLLFLACTKEKNDTHCWQLLDNYGAEMGTVCGKTEEQMKTLYPNTCSWYRQEGETFCWLINGRTFVKDKSQSGIDRYLQCYGGGTAVKVDCSYCKTFYWRLKQTYKPDNSFTYSQVTVQQYCGDTARTLYHGRQVILRDTPDSLIVVQFSSSASF